MESINIYPVLATWKINKKGTCAIHLSVDINGKRAAFPSLKKRIKPDQWDNDHKQVKKTVPNAALLNATIQKKKSEIEAELLKKQLGGKTLNKAMVKKQVKTGKSGADFYYFCLGDENPKDGKKNGQIYLQGHAVSTIDTYKSEVTKLKKFRPVLTFGDIDFSFLKDYAHYMRTDLENSDNTIWKSFKFIHAIIELAKNTGDFLGDNPFTLYDRGQYKQGIPEYLEWPQVQRLHKAIAGDRFTDDLKLTGHYFLLSCYSGLRFGDAVGFDYEKDVIQTAKGDRLVLYATKNGEIVSMAFNKYIAEIVDYIMDRPHPLITNQEFNRRLKLIGAIPEVKKPLKSHMGRHTFGMRCAEVGMSVEATQRLMGHKERSSTLIYFRVKDNRTDKEMDAWVS